MPIVSIGVQETQPLISSHLIHTQAAEGASKTKSVASQFRQWSKIFQQLSKARLSALVVSTTAVGFIAGLLFDQIAISLSHQKQHENIWNMA